MNTPRHHTVCPSCGLEVTQKFCGRCGEKVRNQHSLSLKHVVEEGFESVTHFDGKFFRTLKLLFSSPGSLSGFFEVGRTVQFMKPFQLFIVSNLLFFLVVGQSNVFTLSLGSYLGADSYKKYGTVTTFNREIGEDVPFREVSQLFQEKMAAQSKAYILLFIPVFAVACGLVFWRRKKYFSLHLVFVTHFFSFLLLYFLIFHFLVVLPNDRVYRLSNEAFDSLAVVMNLCVFILYFTLAARRFYHIRWYGALLAATAMAGLFLIALRGYRLALFYKIIYSLPL